MSQAVTASRGRASRTVAGAPARAPALLRRCARSPLPTRLAPSSLGVPGRRCASAASTAFASPTGAPAPRRSRRSGAGRRRRGSGGRQLGAYCPVVSAPSSVPTPRRRRHPRGARGQPARPAPSRRRAGRPRGTRPCPCSRRHRRAEPLRERAAPPRRPERSTPPPAQTTGCGAREQARRLVEQRAVRERGRLGGRVQLPGQDVRLGGSRSTGISTKTGPLGGVSARRQASARSSGISPALSARAAHFTTGAKEAFWSGSSCRKPRPAPIRSRGIWLAIATTGTCALAASISAASEMSAPGPVERRSGAGRPLVRA